MSNNQLTNYVCDKCGNTFVLSLLALEKRKNNHPELLLGKNYCPGCWSSIIQSVPEFKLKMSNILSKVMSTSEMRSKLSKSLKGVNAGEKNGMKKKEARKKLSITRKQMFIDDPLLKEKTAKLTRDAWKDGKFDGVKTGRCKWFEYTDKKGFLHKVQGTYELAFIKWADEKELTITSHTGRIPYIDEKGNERSYYPDFYIDEWKKYVEIKSLYSLQLGRKKMKIIKETIGDKLLILAEKELKELGVQHATIIQKG